MLHNHSTALPDAGADAVAVVAAAEDSRIRTLPSSHKEAPSRKTERKVPITSPSYCRGNRFRNIVNQNRRMNPPKLRLNRQLLQGNTATKFGSHRSSLCLSRLRLPKRLRESL
jgi:hypothetical protein